MTSRIAPQYRVFRTSMGWCAAARSEAGYCAFVLPAPSAGEAEAIVLRVQPGGMRSARRFGDLEESAKGYFNAGKTDFLGFPLDLSSGTPFQRRVWGIVRRIPYGQVRTYGWVASAAKMSKGARAVGAAVGANPLPLLVPCHRVVAAGGALCGFSASGGIDLKARMLELEGVPVSRGEAIRVVV